MVNLRVRAENGTRTRDPNLGKVVLYQLSYCRLIRFKSGAKVRLKISTAKTIHTI